MANGNRKGDPSFGGLGRKFMLAIVMLATALPTAIVACMRGLPFDAWLTFAQWVCISYLGANVVERQIERKKDQGGSNG